MTQQQWSWWWGTVTSVSPLRVRRDTETAALPVTPSSLVTGLRVGERVWCQQAQGGGVIIHAASNDGDTGLVDVTILAGFAPISTSERPQVRRRNGVVFMRGGWSNAGMVAGNTYTVGKLPAGFNPSINIITGIGSSSGAAVGVGFITAGGDVQVRLSPTLGSYYNFGGISWLPD